jgi:CubicO group peptidase (beta-lactamase class C family)
LGFILLGALIENIAGVDLETLFSNCIINPFNRSLDLRFLSLENELKINKELVAATENCGWRKKQLQGEVHDEHCWLMGGVAGHAGLFGSIEGVMALCEDILDIWKDRTVHPAFPNALLQRALEKKHPKESWCLGFDTPSGVSSSGRHLSPRSVGHLGFSGTSFWIDPEKDIVIVLLTNRIYPTKDNIKIREYRPFFHNYIMEKILSELKFR